MTNQTINATTGAVTMATGCSVDVNDGTKIGLTIAHALVLLAALTGNSCVIHLVRTQKKMKVSFNYLVVNMAVADILDACSSIPLNIAFLFVGSRWFPGSFATFLCKINNFVILVSILVSTSTLTVITIERYLATTHVLKRPLSISAVKRVIASIWVLACIMSIHEIIKMDVVQLGDYYFCRPTPIWRGRYVVEMLVKFIVTYAFPLWTMIVLYSMIMCLLWKKEAIGEEIDEYNRRLHKQKKHIVAKLVTIVTIFALCWLPVHVIHLLGTFNLQMYDCLPMWLTLSFYWLAHANSAINPFLYLMLTKNSRALFKAHISGIIRGDGSSGNKHKNKQKPESILFWKKASKKATKTVVI